MPPMSQAGPTNGMAYMGYQPYSMQNMISALPGQDPNMPPQQAYMPGQQPMYQQVRTVTTTTTMILTVVTTVITSQPVRSGTTANISKKRNKQ